VVPGDGKNALKTAVIARPDAWFSDGELALRLSSKSGVDTLASFGSQARFDHKW